MKILGYALIAAGTGILVYLGVTEEAILSFVGAGVVAIGGVIEFISGIIDARKDG